MKNCTRVFIFIFTYILSNTANSESGYEIVVRDGVQYCIVGKFTYPIKNKECKEIIAKTKPTTEMDVLVDNLAERLAGYGGGYNNVQRLREEIRSEMIKRRVSGLSTEIQRNKLQALKILESRINDEIF